MLKILFITKYNSDNEFSDDMNSSYSRGRGTWWCRWLRHCIKSLDVTGLIPDGVTGVFY
jgi:hypothetical protein